MCIGRQYGNRALAEIMQRPSKGFRVTVKGNMLYLDEIFSILKNCFVGNSESTDDK